ncbi:hypothetical protein [Chryseobacterium sp. Mn2064]|uniref:hypothetical protein n=1 Tax=Chryseobacterium sp. Mn2064 TaxID=3395263 RepID=UPI003BE2F314
MKYPFYAALVSLFLISCGNNDNTNDDPRPVDRQIHQFEFISYHITGTVLYKGSLGSKSNPDESYLKNYWSLYKEPAWKKINLDLKNHSIQLISGTSSNPVYTIKIVNDSVFIDDSNIQMSYIGDFSNNTFILKRTFRYVKRMPRNDSDGFTLNQNTFFGTTQYENMFGTVFKNPLEMVKSDDQVLWSNIEYAYKEL